MNEHGGKAGTPASGTEKRSSMGGATSPVSGTLFGVGVGPGDPGLVTLGAAAVIREVVTIAYPVHKEGAVSRALETVRELIGPGVRLLPLLMPMTRDRARLAAAHEAAAQALIEAAASGDVAYLSLGDPLFYSTFGYLADLFPGPVRVISGVSAMSAAAALLGEPLAAGDTATVVVTGGDHDGLAHGLAMNASVVILKPRALDDRSLELIGSVRGWHNCCAVVELGGEKQQVLRKLDRETAARLPYFAIIWVRPAGAEQENPGQRAGSQQLGKMQFGPEGETDRPQKRVQNDR